MKALRRFLVAAILVGVTMLVIVITNYISSDSRYIYISPHANYEGGIGVYEQIQHREVGTPHIPQPRSNVPISYPECMILPIASGYIYYVVIGNSIFPIQDRMDFDFIPPARAEFVFTGTIVQVYEWEAVQGRTHSFLYEHIKYCIRTIFVIIDMYDYNDNRINTLTHVNLGTALDPITDTVKFIGTWNQIRNNNIIDFDKLHESMYAIVDPYDRYYVRFLGIGAWSIQHYRDWNFVPPSYVEVETDLIEPEDLTDEILMIITFNLLDENRNKIDQHTTRLWFAYDDLRPFPVFTGSYVIGTLADLGGVGS